MIPHFKILGSNCVFQYFITGREWKWDREVKDENYIKLISMFADREEALYSIHKISMIGETEGRTVGTWFGPNTIAQVLR